MAGAYMQGIVSGVEDGNLCQSQLIGNPLAVEPDIEQRRTCQRGHTEVEAPAQVGHLKASSTV